MTGRVYLLVSVGFGRVRGEGYVAEMVWHGKEGITLLAPIAKPNQGLDRCTCNRAMVLTLWPYFTPNHPSLTLDEDSWPPRILHPIIQPLEQSLRWRLKICARRQPCYAGSQAMARYAGLTAALEPDFTSNRLIL